MKQSKPYFIFACREHDKDDWSVEFGDYERQTVEFERNDWLDHYNDDNSRRFKKNTRVFRVDNSTNTTIEAAMQRLRETDSAH